MRTSIANDATSTDLEVIREGDQVAFVIDVEGVVTSLTTPTQIYMKEGSETDLSSTYFTGSLSVSGFSIISKTTTGLKRGDYILNVSATVDGQVQTVATIPILVKRRSER